MNFKKKLERDIEKQRQKIDELNTLLIGEQAYLRAQEDMLKLLPKGPSEDSSLGLRPNGDPAKVRELLKKTAAPMHINDILAKLGREVTHNSRSALSGTLGTYARKGQVFTRPAPNTFGLTEFGEKAPSPFDESLPPDFGRDSSDKP